MTILSPSESGSNFSVHSEKGRDHPYEDVAMRQVCPKLTMSPEALGARLWTAHLIANERYFQQSSMSTDGTTASTTFVNGDLIVTATLSDTLLFAATWDLQGKFIGVKQVSREQLLSSDAETNRIQSAGVRHSLVYSDLRDIAQDREQAQRKYGPVVYLQTEWEQAKKLLSLSLPGYVRLSLPRSIGDYHFKPAVTAESTIDVMTIPGLLKYFNVNAFGTLLLISVSDGFTDAAAINNNTYEVFLNRLLKHMSFNETNEAKITEHLVKCATHVTEDDDKTALAQALIKNGKRTDFNGFLGLNDGHGGREAAAFVAEQVPVIFEELLALSDIEYAAHPFSVPKNQDAYDRDNVDSYKIVQQEAEEARISFEHDARRMRFMLKMMLVVGAGIGIAATIKIPILKNLLAFMFNKNHCNECVKQSFFSALGLFFGFNEENAPLNSTASFNHDNYGL